jgi:mannonate dehydratase
LKNNRRDFLKKSATLAATMSIGGIASALPTTGDNKGNEGKRKPFVKDAGIKFAFFMSPTSPKVPFARQMGVLHSVSGVEMLQGYKAWDPEAIKATKEIWAKEGIKWTVVEGPPSLGTQTKLD